MLRLPLLPRWLRWALVVAVAVAILVFSVVPLPGWIRDVGPLGVIPIRRYIHFFAYAGLAGVLVYALADRSWSDMQILIAVFILAVVYGGALEVIQLALPRRRFEVIDVVLNAAGTAMAVVVWRALLARARFYRVSTPVMAGGETG